MQVQIPFDFGNITRENASEVAKLMYRLARAWRNHGHEWHFDDFESFVFPLALLDRKPAHAVDDEYVNDVQAIANDLSELITRASKFKANVGVPAHTEQRSLVAVDVDGNEIEEITPDFATVGVFVNQPVYLPNELRHLGPEYPDMYLGIVLLTVADAMQRGDGFWVDGYAQLHTKDHGTIGLAVTLIPEDMQTHGHHHWLVSSAWVEQPPTPNSMNTLLYETDNVTELEIRAIATLVAREIEAEARAFDEFLDNLV